MSGRKRYPIRVPRYAAGIRAQETRAGAGKPWWSKRWLSRLEEMGLGGRLGRGKSYALSGQVLSMALGGGTVTAVVQGARPDPYTVTIVFRRPEGEVRERIIAALRSDPMLVARLATDDLPIEVEEIFRREGQDFFPGGRLGPGRYDMTTSCTCPDYANPCKHVIAALLILGERIAWRPSTLLECRGISMEELYR